jgi:hypothetical protein
MREMLEVFIAGLLARSSSDTGYSEDTAPPGGLPREERAGHP